MKRNKLLSLILCFILALYVVPEGVTATAMVYSEDVLVDGVGSYEDILGKYVDLEKFKSDLEAALLAMEPKFDLSSYNIPSNCDFLSGVGALVFDGFTDMFHVNEIILWSTEESAAYIEFTYLYTAEEYAAMNKKYHDAISKILNGIQGNDDLSEVEKALLIHDRLALAGEYDYTYSKCTAYDLLIDGSGVCKAYAKAYIALLGKVGIKAEYCHSETLNHAWNIVYIGGKPYHVDVAWDDLAWKKDDRGVLGYVSHNFFMLSTEAVTKEGHVADDYPTTPVDTTYDEYFWRNSNSAFVLVGGQIYYIDHKTEKLMRYGDNAVLSSVFDKWKAGESSSWRGNFSKLTTDGKNLYYSLAKNVWKYDISNSKAEIIFTPELTGYNSIYGLQYRDGYLVCDTNTAPPFGGGEELAQVSFKLDTDDASETSIIIKEGTSLSSDGTYLYGIKCGDKVSKLLGDLDNTCAFVFDNKGNQLSASDNCFTGCVVSLVVDGIKLDSLSVIILGDVDGSGTIDSTDYMRVKSGFIGTYSLSGAAFCAADVTRDGVVDATDYMRIKSVFLGTFSGTF